MTTQEEIIVRATVDNRNLVAGLGQSRQAAADFEQAVDKGFVKIGSSAEEMGNKVLGGHRAMREMGSVIRDLAKGDFIQAAEGLARLSTNFEALSILLNPFVLVIGAVAVAAAALARYIHNLNEESERQSSWIKSLNTDWKAYAQAVENARLAAQKAQSELQKFYALSEGHQEKLAEGTDRAVEAIKKETGAQLEQLESTRNLAKAKIDAQVKTGKMSEPEAIAARAKVDVDYSYAQQAFKAKEAQATLDTLQKQKTAIEGMMAERKATLDQATKAAQGTAEAQQRKTNIETLTLRIKTAEDAKAKAEDALAEKMGATGALANIDEGKFGHALVGGPKVEELQKEIKITTDQLALDNKRLEKLSGIQDAMGQAQTEAKEAYNRAAEENTRLADKLKEAQSAVDLASEGYKKVGTDIQTALTKAKTDLDLARRSAAADAGYLSVEQLAGRRYTNMIGQQYGPGGRFDLGGERRGWMHNKDAQELYRLTHGATQYDRLYGTKENVDWDIDRIGKLRANLGKNENLDPAERQKWQSQNLDKIKDGIDALNKLAAASGIPVQPISD